MTEKMTGPEALNYIQCNIKAPKSQRNTFGKYDYRSCEDILEALKPLLSETGCCLVISDEVVAVGDRFYIKATAILSKGVMPVAHNTAFAREALTKKGMDDAQVTGSVSSYARKYALNGMFLIDDSKNIDSTNVDLDNAEANTSKPRIAHSVQVKKAVAAINSVETIEQLKDTYSKSSEYFKKWSQPGHIETITKAKDAMKAKLGA